MNEESVAHLSRRSPFARPLLAVALAASALSPPAAQAALLDVFLKLDGIEGESAADKHSKEIDVVSFSDGFALAASAGAGRVTGRTVCDGITLKKYVDKASVKLLEALFTGRTIASGELAFVATGEGQQTFYKIQLGTITVTALSQAGPVADGASSFLFESLTLQPASYKFSYSPQSDKGGLGAPITFSGHC